MILTVVIFCGKIRNRSTALFVSPRASSHQHPYLIPSQRKKGFKKGVDLEESRRRREETTLQIRKTKKEDRLNKRRQQNPGTGMAGMTEQPMSMGGDAPQAKLENLARMVAGVMGNDATVQTEYTTQFRRLLSIEKNPPIQQVIDSGVVPRFIEFLQRDDSPALQFEAAWALTNIASGTSDNTQVVIEYGAVPIFVRLLSSPNDDVREQAVWALGNIAGDSPPCRDLVLDCGAMQPLLAQLQAQSKMSMLRNATWTLSNFCRGKPQPKFERVKIALPILAELIFQKDEEVLTDACWALSYLSDGPNEKIQAVIEAGVCRRLIELLMNPSPAVQTPALRTVGNIVTGTDLQTQFIINHNTLPCLLSLLSNAKKGIRKEACWTISNITAGNKDQIQSVIDNNIIPPLIQLLDQAEFEIRKEAAWAISNATSGGTGQQICFLVHQGCIPPLCDLLGVSDTKIITIALEGLENILKVGLTDATANGTLNDMARHVAEADGLSKIEDLQQHSDNDIYEKCVRILETYFGVDDEEEMPALAPGMDGNQFTFGGGDMDGATPTFDFGSGHA